MSFFKTITQGGQVNIHQLHMLKQVLMAGLMVAVISGGGYFFWQAFTIPSSDWRQAYERYWASFMLATTSTSTHHELYQLYVPPHGRAYEIKVVSILKDPFIKRTTEKVERFVKKTAYHSLGVGVAALAAVLSVWFFIGLRQRQAKHGRGNTLLPWTALARLLKRRRQTSDLKLGELPLLKDKETSHILITGTTGSGKTNSFHILLPQIRKRKNKAIIVDVTGDYVSRYYDETTDLLLNPLDQRSLNWHPWADCHLESHYDVLADSLIQPKVGSKDPFWDNASRVLLKTALRKYAVYGSYDIEALYDFLVSASDREFEDFFGGTEAATYASARNDKTTHSIRSVLSSQIEGFRQLESLNKETDRKDTPEEDAFSEEGFYTDDLTEDVAKIKGEKDQDTSPDSPLKQAFSIRNWVMDEKQQGWLFITARADQRQTLTPLISAWVDISLNALMVLPENQQRRLWFVVDELAALQKLPRLQMGLAEGRKYGGCLLVGFQSKPQLEDIYGRNAAEAMLDLFNTKIFFRCTEPSTQQWVSKVLGDKEEAEATENISFGANSLRDGVSLGRQTRHKPLVMPTELSLLKDLECYLKYPGDLPSTKIQTKYQAPSLEHKAPFLLKPEKTRISAPEQKK